MKLLTAILFFVFLTAVSIAADRESPAGAYVQNTGIYVIKLTLLANGSYLARWDADIGSNGTASGSWELVGGEVHLSPKKEEDMMKGYLRVLFVREFEGEKALLRKEDIKGEKFPFSYFFLQGKKPNTHSNQPRQAKVFHRNLGEA